MVRWMNSLITDLRHLAYNCCNFRNTQISTTFKKFVNFIIKWAPFAKAFYNRPVVLFKFLWSKTKLCFIFNPLLLYLNFYAEKDHLTWCLEDGMQWYLVKFQGYKFRHFQFQDPIENIRNHCSKNFVSPFENDVMLHLILIKLPKTDYSHVGWN